MWFTIRFRVRECEGQLKTCGSECEGQLKTCGSECEGQLTVSGVRPQRQRSTVNGEVFHMYSSTTCIQCACEVVTLNVNDINRRGRHTMPFYTFRALREGCTAHGVSQSEGWPCLGGRRKEEEVRRKKRVR